MPAVDPVLLKQPLTPEEPCGPDLEVAGDSGYLNALARIEGVLPDSFADFVRDNGRDNIDLPGDTKVLTDLLARSRDLRPLVLLAKIGVLARNLSIFVECLEGVEALLSTFWTDVHPNAANGGEVLRVATLQTLDDLPSVVLPLQVVPLVETRRVTIAFRDQMVVAGEVAPRADGSGADAATIERSLNDVDLDALVATRDLLARLSRAVAGIRLATMQNAGSEGVPSLDRLAQLIGRMLDFIDSAVGRRAPGAALGGAREPVAAEEEADGSTAGPAKAAPIGRIGSTAQAAAALGAVVDYLSAREPSSPSLLLVRGARQLIGRSFVDIMRQLLPDALKEAKILVGGEQPIVFRLDQVPEDEVIAEASDEAVPGTGPVASTRQEAQQLLDEVAAFYRVAEPSNPIPLLCERARAMTALDFATLLKDIVPKKK